MQLIPQNEEEREILQSNNKVNNKNKKVKARTMLSLLIVSLLLLFAFILTKKLAVPPDHLPSDLIPVQEQTQATNNSSLSDIVSQKSEEVIDEPKIELKQSKQEIQSLIQRMKFPKNRPKAFPKLQKSLEMEDQVYFAYSLSSQPENQDYLEAEWYYYNQKYNLDQISTELPLCIVMVGRNLKEKYRKMIQSISVQNYTHYHGVYIDDASTDGTVLKFQKAIEQNSQLKNKFKVEAQDTQKYALYNRNLAIRKHCRRGEIIVDIDADDWLIGRQVFKLINAIYQTRNAWAVYFNNIIYFKICKCPLPNSDKPFDKTLLENYRTANLWRTTELRTFLFDLYIKIDESDFVDPRTSQFYKWKSDSFMHFSIVELAGPQRIQFIDEFVYFYDDSFKQPKPERNHDRLAAKTLTPYLQLTSLEEEAQRMRDYSPPQSLMKELGRANEIIKG